MKKWNRWVTLFVTLLPVILLATPALAQTENGNALYISNEQVLAVPSKSGGTLQVLATVTVQNNGQAYPTAYQLPIGAQNPHVVAGSAKQISLAKSGALRFTAKANGVTTLAVEFGAPLNQNGTELTWKEPMPVRQLFFVIPEGSLTVSSQGGFQTDSQSIMSGNQAFRQFTRLAIPANSSWTVSVALLPTANGRQAPPLPNIPVLNSYGPRVADLEAIGNLLLVALILIIGIISIRQGGRRKQYSVLTLGQQKSELMEHWADLEMAYASGELQEQDYQHRRERLKQRVIQVESMLRNEQQP